MYGELEAEREACESRGEVPPVTQDQWLGTGTSLLPAFAEEEYETHVSAYAECERMETVAQIEKGAVVASLERRYGESSIERFSHDVGEAPSTLRDYARVYGRLAMIPEEHCSQILDYVMRGPLRYSHLRRAASLDSNEEFFEVLTKAHDQEWRVKDVGDAVAIRKGLQPPPTPQEPPRSLDERTGPSEDAPEVSPGLRYPSIPPGATVNIETRGLESDWYAGLWVNLGEPDTTREEGVRLVIEALEDLDVTLD